MQEDCLNIVLELFKESSLRFTMDDVAERLGISKKTLYALYKSKEELLISALHHGFKSIHEEKLSIKSNPNLTLTQKINTIIIAMPEAYRSINWNMLNSIHTKYPSLYKELIKELESGWEDTLSIIREGMDQGIIRNINIDLFKIIVEGCYEHFLNSPALSQVNISYEDALTGMADILINGIIY